MSHMEKIKKYFPEKFLYQQGNNGRPRNLIKWNGWIGGFRKVSLTSACIRFHIKRTSVNSYLVMLSDNQSSIPENIFSISNLIEKDNVEKIRVQLIDLINELINKDFRALLQILYRIDVDEKKIRYYLEENINEDSASVLADMIIKRQLQKIESRKDFSQKHNESDEEKW